MRLGHRTVLIVAAAELELSLWVLRMDAWGYRVIKAENAARARLVLESEPDEIYALMLRLPMEDVGPLLETGRELQPEMRSLVLGETREWNGNLQADAYLPKGGDSPMEVRERIRILVARKRGPKTLSVVAKKPAGSVGLVIERMAACG